MKPFPLSFFFDIKFVSSFAFSLLFLIVITSYAASADPPAAFDLSTGDYSFTEWDETEPAGKYPPNMVFMQSGSRDPGLNDEFDSPWPCDYDLTSRSRINGLGEDGISFYNTSTSQDGCDGKYIGAAVLSLNTTGRTYITVNWLAETLSFANNEGQPRENRIRLQYRTDTNAAFVDVVNENGDPFEYVFNKTMPNVQNISAVLPWDAEGRELIQLRWVYYLYKDGGGTRVKLRLDDIHISSESPADEPPAKLAIAATVPNNPMQNAPFRTVIRSTNEEDIPKNVTQDTDIRVLLKNGSGELSGTVLGTIPDGENTLVLDEVIYNASGLAVIEAEVISGESLGADSKEIDFLDGPLSLAVSEFYNKNHIPMALQEFSVSAVDETGDPVEEYTGYEITLKKLSGPGNVLGTSTQKSINGVAVFVNISFDAKGTYKLTASIAGLPDSEVQTVFVKDMPEMAELKIPKYIKGEGDFGTRVPAFALVELSNLHQNSVYRYSTGARDTAYYWPGYDPQYDPGAGNNFQHDERTGEYTYNLGNDVSAEGEYSVFVTGENETSKKIWLNIVSTRNSTFAEGNEVYWILHLGNDVGELLHRYPTTNTSKAIDFGTGSSDATGIFDRDSWMTDKNYLLL